MKVMSDGKVNPQSFELDLRKATHDWADVLLLAADTRSAQVESTHFLMALGKVAGGATARHLAALGMNAQQWEEGLAQCAQTTDDPPPAQLDVSALDRSSVELLAEAEILCERYGKPRVSEPILLLAALRHLTPSVEQLFRAAAVDTQRWCAEIEDSLRPVEAIAVFEAAEPNAVKTAAFSHAGRRILDLLRTEAESLGHSEADPRHLLLALLEHSDGAAQYGLHGQGLTPRKIQEAVALRLRHRGRRSRTEVPLRKGSLQPLLRQILVRSGELAGRGRAPAITEAHLLRAFLEVESSARQILLDEKVDLHRLAATAEHFEEPAEGSGPQMVDAQTVRQRLQRCLVGQDHAIECVLPYVELMRLGFSTPGRPVGVFLFCGQSGSGKTQLAKELARAVYGSEENLIYLEMGQFNAPESMNIFVGAAPGYVGYGEGKLTNGLRDKPQSVVLFDEVEKAHAKVLDALLRFLDEGRIDDPAGPVRDGSQCIVILTSNVGGDSISKLWESIERGAGAGLELRKRLREEFQKHQFRVEFLNRVDEVVLFRALKREDYVEIARRQQEELLSALKSRRQIEVVPDEGLAEALGAYCATINEGARAVPRLLNRLVVLPVGRHMLEHKLIPPVKLKVRLVKGAGGADEDLRGEIVPA